MFQKWDRLVAECRRQNNQSFNSKDKEEDVESKQEINNVSSEKANKKDDLEKNESSSDVKDQGKQKEIQDESEKEAALKTSKDCKTLQELRC